MIENRGPVWRERERGGDERDREREGEGGSFGGSFDDARSGGLSVTLLNGSSDEIHLLIRGD